MAGYLDWLVFHQDAKQSGVKCSLHCTQKQYPGALRFIILTSQRFLPTLLHLPQDKDLKNKQTNKSASEQYTIDKATRYSEKAAD